MEILLGHFLSDLSKANVWNLHDPITTKVDSDGFHRVTLTHLWLYIEWKNEELKSMMCIESICCLCLFYMNEDEKWVIDVPEVTSSLHFQGFSKNVIKVK